MGAVVGGGAFDDVGGAGVGGVGDDARVVAIAFGLVGVEQIFGRCIQ